MGNIAGSYGVSIQPAEPNAEGYAWRAMYVAHVPPSRNGNRHNVYINVTDEGNHELRRATDVRVVWGWEGQRPDEPAPPLALDKPVGEWMTNIALFPGQRVWCRVDGRGIPSDTVRGMHTNHPRGGDGDGEGHHSFEIIFQLLKGTPGPMVVIPRLINSTAISHRLRILAGELQAVANEVDLNAREAGEMDEAKG